MECCPRSEMITKKDDKFYLNNVNILFCPFCAVKLGKTVGPELVFDLDGVLCEQASLVNGYRDYANAKPYLFAIEHLRKVRKMGFKIIIQTARGMGRSNGDQNKARALCFDETYEWLMKHNVPFDELLLGKGSGYLYIDDKAVRVDSRQGEFHWMINFWPAIEKLRKA